MMCFMVINGNRDVRWGWGRAGSESNVSPSNLLRMDFRSCFSSEMRPSTVVPCSDKWVWSVSISYKPCGVHKRLSEFQSPFLNLNFQRVLLSAVKPQWYAWWVDLCPITGFERMWTRHRWRVDWIVFSMLFCTELYQFKRDTGQLNPPRDCIYLPQNAISAGWHRWVEERFEIRMPITKQKSSEFGLKISHVIDLAMVFGIIWRWCGS